MDTYVKDPDATLDYEKDWTAWLAPEEVITSATWLTSGDLAIATMESTDRTATVWLTGGTADTDYRVTNRVVTNQGRTDDRSILIQCRNR